MKLNEQGISLILTMLILSGLISIALVVSSITLSEIRFGRTMGHSIPSFFAADSGVEKLLTNRDNPSPVSGELDNGAVFDVVVTASGPDCAADNYCIKSVGEFGPTKRAIEVNY